MDRDVPLDAPASGDLSHQLDRAASTIEQVRAEVHLRLRSEYWFGSRADSVRRSWESIVGPTLDESARLLRAMSREVSGAIGHDVFNDDPDHA
ncbi:MAG: hypothetical protein JWN39_3321 [Ilumatobacteraceae bacterium]|nr:hypothetical protein [Ilumatobacteraceae bacterium]MCU1397571.1 hypothetical protein [Acidimicrobiales bacterium]